MQNNPFRLSGYGMSFYIYDLADLAVAIYEIWKLSGNSTHPIDITIEWIKDEK